MPSRRMPYVFACPSCSTVWPEVAPEHIVCATCGKAYAIRESIYRFLLPGRLDQLQPSFKQYRQVRQQTSYRIRTPSYYNSLPWLDAH